MLLSFTATFLIPSLGYISQDKEQSDSSTHYSEQDPTDLLSTCHQRVQLSMTTEVLNRFFSPPSPHQLDVSSSSVQARLQVFLKQTHVSSGVTQEEPLRYWRRSCLQLGP